MCSPPSTHRFSQAKWVDRVIRIKEFWYDRCHSDRSFIILYWLPWRFYQGKQLIKFVKINSQFTFVYVTCRRSEGYLMELITFFVILLFTYAFLFILKIWLKISEMHVVWWGIQDWVPKSLIFPVFPWRVERAMHNALPKQLEKSQFSLRNESRSVERVRSISTNQRRTSNLQ
jgi:hypothetical protein